MTFNVRLLLLLLLFVLIIRDGLRSLVLFSLRETDRKCVCLKVQYVTFQTCNRHNPSSFHVFSLLWKLAPPPEGLKQAVGKGGGVVCRSWSRVPRVCVCDARSVVWKVLLKCEFWCDWSSAPLSQVRSENGHVDGRGPDERQQGRRGGVFTRGPPVRGGRVRRPGLPEHRGGIRPPDQRVDSGLFKKNRFINSICVFVF